MTIKFQDVKEPFGHVYCDVGSGEAISHFTWGMGKRKARWGVIGVMKFFF